MDEDENKELDKENELEKKSTYRMWIGIISVVAVFAFLILNSNSLAKTSFPPQAQNVLNCRWSQSDNQWGFSKPIGEQILESTGNSQYIGSMTYPMDISVSNADYGASNVNIKIKEGNGNVSALFVNLSDPNLGTNEVLEFDYWVSEDGLHIKPTNDNAQKIWTLYSNG